VRIIELTTFRISIPNRINNRKKNTNNRKKNNGISRPKLIGSGDYKTVIRKELAMVSPMLKGIVKSALTNAGGVAGSYVGGKLGNSRAGARVGKNLAARISKLVGSGDYSTNTTAVNSLMKGSSSTTSALASFGSTSGGIRLQHREYIEDVYAGATNSFSIASYPVNPGLASTFQYLSQIANNFEEYIFHGLVFEFVSTTSPYLSGGAMGSVVISMEYDAALAAFTSKPQMENSDFAISARPDTSIMYGVECKDQPLNGRYVRGGATLSSQPINLTDIGTLYIANQNTSITQGQSLGELWVTYDVEFRKPHISPSRWGIAHFYGTASATSSVTPLPSTLPLAYAAGSLFGTAISSNLIKFPNANLGDTYMITYADVYSAAATITTNPVFSTNGFANFNTWNGDANCIFSAPVNGTNNTGTFTIMGTFTVNNISSTPYIGFSNGGVLSATPTHQIDIFIVNMGNGLNTTIFP